MPELSKEWVRALHERSLGRAAVELEALRNRDPEALEESAELARRIGWGCPYHRLAAFKVSAKTGRQYVGCPLCGCFARDRPPVAELTAIPPVFEDDLPF